MKVSLEYFHGALVNHQCVFIAKYSQENFHCTLNNRENAQVKLANLSTFTVNNETVPPTEPIIIL